MVTLMYMQGVRHTKHRRGGNDHDTSKVEIERKQVFYQRKVECNKDTIVDHPSKLTYKETQLIRIHSRYKFITGEVSYNLFMLTSVSGSFFHSLGIDNKKHNMNN
jgi:hypothetical protein